MRERNRNSIKSSLSLIVILMTMICTATSDFHAQGLGEQTTIGIPTKVRVVEALPDGSYIVEIGGKKFRALDAVRMHAIEQRKLDAEICAAALEKSQQDKAVANAERDRWQQAFMLKQKDAELSEAQTEIWKARAEKWELAYNGEHALRLQADALLEKADKLMKRGAVSSFFENPYVQIGTKILVPAVQVWISSGRQH